MGQPTEDPTVAQPEDAERAPGPGGIARGYADQHHPLGADATLAVTFGTLFAAGLLALERSGRPVPSSGVRTRPPCAAAALARSRYVPVSQVTHGARRRRAGRPGRAPR